MELDFFVRSRIKKNSFLIPRYAIVEYDEKCDEPEVAELFDHAFSGLVDRFGLGDDELALTCEFSDGIKIYSHSNFNVMFPVMESVEVLDSLSGYDVKFPFIWCGEAEEGLHVGPIIKSVEDLSFYTSIFRNYRSNKDVREMVGIEKIPTSLAFWIRHKATVDTAIEKLLALNGNNRKVILLETLETKHLGVPDDIPTRNSDGFYAEMSWSKGFLYGAENIECDEAGIYHACSLVPDVESESLAACAGKGSSPEEAMIKDVGESVERYNAWSPDVLYHGHAGIADRIIKIDEIHVKKYASCDEDIESFLSVTNISDADDVRYVPAELVVIGPFNYRASCSSDTTGLAAHVTREDCRESALYECIERHHFYPNITNLNTPIQCLDLYEITKNFKKNSEVEFVIFTYFTNLYTFVIHCFAFNTRKKIWTRGTGSAANVYVASEKAVQEAMQLMLRLENDILNEDVADGYLACCDPAAYSFLKDYLSRSEYVSVDRLKSLVRGYDLFSTISAIESDGYKIYVFDFPSKFPSWFSCRIIIPNFVRSQFKHGMIGSIAIGDKLPFMLPF